ncbi:MAG TPA: hypothetical protein VLB84_02055 [Bacteroidia bacterium]|jgi:hypothetical protein|nr:hypothetical protein [Bacteroidia bacterium]
MSTHKTILTFLLFHIVLFAFPQGDTIKIKTSEPPQKPYYQPFVLKTSPTALLWGGIFPYTSEFRVMAEITNGRTQSEQISISYLFPNIFLAAIAALSNDKLEAIGWRLQYAHKFYLIRRKKFAPYGFYVAPLVSYANAHISWGNTNSYGQEYLDFRHFNINAIVGVQIGKFHRVTMDSYFGLGYRKNTVLQHLSSNQISSYNTADFGELYNLPLNAVFGINLGYSF